MHAVRSVVKMRRPSVLSPVGNNGNGTSNVNRKGGETTSGWVKHCAFDNASNAPRDEPARTFVAIRASNASNAQSHVYVFTSPDDYHRHFMNNNDNAEKEDRSMLHKGAVSEIAHLHELTHPVTGNKAIEIEWKNGTSWMLEASTEREHQHWLQSLRNAIQFDIAHYGPGSQLTSSQSNTQSKKQRKREARQSMKQFLYKKANLASWNDISGNKTPSATDAKSFGIDRIENVEHATQANLKANFNSNFGTDSVGTDGVNNSHRSNESNGYDQTDQKGRSRRTKQHGMFVPSILALPFQNMKNINKETNEYQNYPNATQQNENDTFNAENQAKITKLKARLEETKAAAEIAFENEDDDAEERLAAEVRELQKELNVLGSAWNRKFQTGVNTVIAANRFGWERIALVQGSSQDSSAANGGFDNIDSY